MKINVLYDAEGRILALSPVSRPIDRGATVATLRSGPQPLGGQRLAVVDVDIAAPSLLEIHRRFVVVDTETGARLRDQSTPAHPADVSTAFSKPRREKRHPRGRSRRR